MKKGLDRLAAANVKNISLTDFDSVIAESPPRAEYIKAEDDFERLIAFRDNPSDESLDKGVTERNMRQSYRYNGSYRRRDR